MPGIPTAAKTREAIEAFDKWNAPFLKEGDRCVASFCDSIFSAAEAKSYAEQPKPLNMTHRGATVLVASIGANEPRHAVTARRLELVGEAELHSLRLDYDNERLDRVNISRRGILNTLLRGRTVKRVGLKTGPERIRLNGRQYDPGMTFLKIVPNHKHGFDFTAPERPAMRWEFERYWVRTEQARAMYGPKVDKIAKAWERRQEEKGDAQVYGAQELFNEDAYVEDMIELLDIVYYDSDGEWYMCTLPSDPGEMQNDYLAVRTVEAIDQGIFLWEEYCPSPVDGIESVAWASQQMVQTLICSRLMNKIVDEAVHAKNLILARLGTSEEEQTQIRTARDGEVVLVADPEAYTQIQLRGVIPDCTAILSLAQRWWNAQSGQVDQLAGATEGDPTATQYSGDMANAQQITQDIKKRHQEHEEKVSRALAHYNMTDPGPGEMMAMKLQSGLQQVPYMTSALQGKLSDFEFKIQAHSMPAQDANVMLKRLLEFLEIMAPYGCVSPKDAARVVGDAMGLDQVQEMVPDPAAQLQTSMAMNAMEGLPPMGAGTGMAPQMMGMQPGGMPQPPMPGQAPMGRGPVIRGHGAPQMTTPVANVRSAMGQGVGR